MLRWLHRSCIEHLAGIARDRDRLESALFRLQKQYDDLMVTYKELVEHSLAKFQFPNVDHLFSEDSIPDDRKNFLTPPWEDREGISTE